MLTDMLFMHCVSVTHCEYYILTHIIIVTLTQHAQCINQSLKCSTVQHYIIFSPNLYKKNLLKIRPFFWLFMLLISENFVLKFTQKRFKNRPRLHQRASKYPGLPGP